MSSARILIVEDDPTSRQLMAQMLVGMGHQVVSAADGNEALQYLYSEEICDVVIADVVMPVMSGVELVSRVHDARPGLPVVLMTGKADGIASALSGGTLALIKPLSSDRISRVLDEALGSD